MKKVPIKKIPLSELRQNLRDVIDKVYYTKNNLVVTRQNKPKVLITPVIDRKSKGE